MIEARIQAEPFSVEAELSLLEALGGGAVASFTGLVRGGGGLVDMTLEHHPAMTLPQLRAIAEEAVRRWPLAGVALIHRYGTLAPGERIVFVGTAAAHRAAALDACAFLIDWAKTRAPFWKRERFENGTERWVDAKADDDEAAARWG